MVISELVAVTRILVPLSNSPLHRKRSFCPCISYHLSSFPGYLSLCTLYRSLCSYYRSLYEYSLTIVYYKSLNGRYWSLRWVLLVVVRALLILFYASLFICSQVCVYNISSCLRWNGQFKVITIDF
jgi:hypothetical protein